MKIDQLQAQHFFAEGFAVHLRQVLFGATVTKVTASCLRVNMETAKGPKTGQIMISHLNGEIVLKVNGPWLHQWVLSAGFDSEACHLNNAPEYQL
jgi:hypothetical protein